MCRKALPPVAAPILAGTTLFILMMLRLIRVAQVTAMGAGYRHRCRVRHSGPFRRIRLAASHGCPLGLVFPAIPGQAST